ncbi:MAG: hypothetical protein M1833_003900, partial [Piccolia ochrophora]
MLASIIVTLQILFALVAAVPTPDPALPIEQPLVNIIRIKINFLTNIDPGVQFLMELVGTVPGNVRQTCETTWRPQKTELQQVPCLPDPNVNVTLRIPSGDISQGFDALISASSVLGGAALRYNVGSLTENRSQLGGHWVCPRLQPEDVGYVGTCHTTPSIIPIVLSEKDLAEPSSGQ